MRTAMENFLLLESAARLLEVAESVAKFVLSLGTAGGVFYIAFRDQLLKKTPLFFTKSLPNIYNLNERCVNRGLS